MKARLSQKEKDILGIIEHSANKPLSSFAKTLGLKDTTIRYNVQNLLESGVIEGSSPFIDATRLGYSYYTVLFSISANSPEKRLALEKHVSTIDGVTWAAILGGDYQYGMTVAAASIEQVANILNSLASKSKTTIIEKSVQAKLRFVKFPRMYLSSKVPDDNEMSYDATLGNMRLDEQDHRILAGLDERGDQSLRHLERSLGIPFSTIRRRIQRLEESNLIVGYLFRYNPNLLGILSYSFLVYTRGLNPTLSKELYEYAKNHPQVVLFVENLGSWDYEIGLETFSARDVSALRNELFDRFGDHIHGISPLQIFQPLRLSGYPFSGIPNSD